MFGQLRPKPDARMLRRAGAPGCACRRAAACWSRTRCSTRRRRARSACARSGCSATLRGRCPPQPAAGPAGATSTTGCGRCARCRVCENRLAAGSSRISSKCLPARERSTPMPECRGRPEETPAIDAAEPDATGAPPASRPVRTPAAHGRARRRASAPSRASGACRSCRRWPSMLEQPGAERITTAALAAKLDVSEAALYRHFASKAQMFEGLIEFIEQQRVHAGQPDHRARDRRAPRRRSSIVARAAAVRREEPRHDARDGRRRAGVRERAPARCA